MKEERRYSLCVPRQVVGPAEVAYQSGCSPGDMRALLVSSLKDVSDAERA